MRTFEGVNLKPFLILLGGSVAFALLAGMLLLSAEAQKRKAAAIIDADVARQIEPEEVPTGTNTTLPISRVEPDPDRGNVSTSPKIVVFFKNNMSGKKVELTVTPAFDFNGSFDRTGTELTVYPNTALQPQTTYTVAVQVEGTIVYSWRFTTGNGSLSDSESDSLVRLKAALPYRDQHFWIEYKSISDKFFIYIDAKPLETYRQAALAFFRSRGISDPLKLNLEFIPVGNAANP